ncbi:MAG: Gfo/Idh/MocA family oxidoreductase, partial [Gammaproteobacteria bacterium]|nr:Gfo/Idh/MocA family oxidoreductase [Gammaproteobacteria bacterium]
MIKSPYKVAVVGCGAVANMHARHLATEPHATLVAVVDTNRKRAEEFAANWKVANVYEDLEEAIKAADVSAVQIATPPSSHASLVACAIRNNCHVLVEK